ncbi:MAG: transporter substrate-binding domain-containing protein [Pseudomonadota bacterium]
MLRQFKKVTRALLALLSIGAPLAAAETVPDELIAEVPSPVDGRLATILAQERIVVGVKADYEPWGFISPNGSIDGLEIDLARDIAARLGVALELVPVTATNRIDRVNQGYVHVVIATTGDTRERRAQADLLQPNYYSSGVVVYGRKDLGIADWEELRNEKICLNRNAYYNRALETDFGLDGQYFSGRREAMLALKYQRCVGWAFDDTALVRFSRDNPSNEFAVLTEPILSIPWSIIVAKGEGNRSLGLFISDMIGEWHASGRLLELQDKWNIPRTTFLEELHRLWKSQTSGGPTCARNAETGLRAAVCVDSAPYAAAPRAVVMGHLAQVEEITGLDLAPLASPYDRGRILRGLWLTLLLSAISVLGALVIGITFALLNSTLRPLGVAGRILLAPQTALIMVARMTPPILQLYIIFFGLGGLFLTSPELAPGAFSIACLIFSIYAGSANAVMIIHALEHTRATTPEASALQLLPSALRRCFDGLVAACINIVKAAGMASAIAVPELVSSINLAIAEGADASTLMNGLLVFYFLLITLLIWAFRKARAWAGVE